MRWISRMAEIKSELINSPDNSQPDQEMTVPPAVCKGSYNQQVVTTRVSALIVDGDHNRQTDCPEVAQMWAGAAAPAKKEISRADMLLDIRSIVHRHGFEDTYVFHVLSAELGVHVTSLEVLDDRIINRLWQRFKEMDS